jgi:hypothetical protein
MLRRTPMPRGTKPLKRHSPLATRKPMKAGQAKGAVSGKTRRTLAERSEGICEMQLVGCTWYAVDPSHRIPRGLGGRHRVARTRADLLSNVMHACRTCHEWLHARPAEAYELGLFLKEGQVPSQEAVLYRGEVMYLDDLGGVHDFEDVGA